MTAAESPHIMNMVEATETAIASRHSLPVLDFHHPPSAVCKVVQEYRGKVVSAKPLQDKLRPPGCSSPESCSTCETVGSFLLLSPSNNNR